MKKLLSIVLVFAMLLSFATPFAVAQDLDNNIDYSQLLKSTIEGLTQAERFEFINNPYTQIDLALFEDLFATDEDLANENWDNTSTTEKSNILAYKGFAYSNYSNRYPMDAKYEGTATANVIAFRTSQIESTEGITKEADGSYIYTMDSTPFKLGEIAETGKQGANAFLIRAVYNPTFYADAENPINEVPDNYLTTGGKVTSTEPSVAVGQGVYTINQSGLKSAELLMAPMYNAMPTYHTVYVTYEGEKTPVKYFAVSGYATADMKDKIYLVPQETYEGIRDGSGDAIMKLPNEYTLEEFKAIVGDDSLTKLPGNWKDYSEKYNEYLAATKYQQLKSSTDVVALSSKDTVDLKKLSANCEAANVLLPTAVQQFVPSQRVYTTTKVNKLNYNTYTYKISVPLDPSKKVETIKIAGELRSPVDFVEESGGFAKVASNSTVHSAVLMLDYDGQDMVEFDGQKYYVFCDIQRECGTGALLGMTLVDNENIYEEYLTLNEKLKAVDPAVATPEECALYRSEVAQLITKANGYIIESDFDFSKVIAAEARHEAENAAANAGELVKRKNKVNFPISEATGANAKFFMADGAPGDVVDNDTSNDYTDYLFGVDYNGNVVYENSCYLYTGTSADFANKSTTNFGAFVYTLDKGSANTSPSLVDLVTKEGNIYWNVNDVDYQVNPLEKVIKVYLKVKTADTLTDEAIKARFNSLAQVTLDVPDGYYDSVGVLAGSGTATRAVKLQLVYKDGSKGTVESLNTGTSGLAKESRCGFVYAQKINAITGDNRNANGGIGFVPVTITAESSKMLDKVIVTPTSHYNPIFVVSAWGNQSSIEEKLAELDSIEITDEDSMEAAKAAIADFDAYLSYLGYTHMHLGSYIASYNNLLERIALFEKDGEKNEVINTKYTNINFVGPWDMFATGDDIKDANWKVTSTAAAPNILAYKGFNQSSSGNIQPSASNVFAFRADFINESNIELKDDGRHYINVGSVPFKLGEIKTTAGERGTNGWIPRGKLTPNTITEGLIPDIATTGDVTYQYGTSGYATNIMNGTFAINNSSVSAINFLTTGVFYGEANNRLYDVYVTYEGEEDNEQHGYMFAGNLTQQIDEAVYAIPAETFNGIMNDDSLAASMKELEAYTVDEINALRGYTPTTTVDTSKTITSKNYTLAQLNEALGINLVKFPTSWIKAKVKDASGAEVDDTTLKDVHAGIVAKTKQVAINNVAVTLKSLSAGLDTTKLASAYTYETVAIPTESTSFVQYRRGNWNKDYDTVVSYTKFPVDPNKKVKSVRIEGNLTDIKGAKGIALGSGGVYSLEEYNTGRGVMLLTYDGQKTVNIGGVDYVLYMKIQRECADSMFLGATYERKSTIKEEIDSINERINAIDENTKVTEIIAIRENIESLKAESSYVADTDFEMDKLVAAEGTLSSRKVTEATKAMSAITETSTIEEANAAKELYDYALEDANITEASFDATVVALFNMIHAKIADRTNLKGTINVKYFKGETPSAEVTIENATKFAGKPYKIIFAYYDADENLLGTYIEDKFSAKDETVTFIVKADKDYENATSVKGFIWKDFTTLIPLSVANKTTKKTAFKVLSIGNSFSQNAHTYLGEIAQNAGFEKIIIENIFKGGCTLDTHYNNLSGNPDYILQRKELVDGKIKSTSKADATMLEGIIAEDWDVITIQQGSSHSAKPEKFTYLQDIVDYVNEHKTNPDAKIVWHQTWAYKEGSDNLQSTYPGMTQMDMYNGIMSAVKNKVLTLNAFDYVIPAGTVAQNIRAACGEIVMSDSDNIHLNNVGCYAIGLAWFEKITGISADTITYVPDNSTIKNNLAAIKKAVKDALANPYEVTK